MAGEVQSPETIFCNAISIESAEERARFLKDACHGNIDLLQGVEKLVEDRIAPLEVHVSHVGQVAPLDGAHTVSPSGSWHARYSRWNSSNRPAEIARRIRFISPK